MSAKLWKIFLGFAIPLAILGLVLLVVGKVKETGEEEKYITVVDAGGSGTRLAVYKFKDIEQELEQYKVECEDKGLQNWDDKDFPELEKQLSACYEKGQALLPEDAKNTPVWFGATAGMRLMKYRDPKKADAIWEVVQRSLNATDYNVLWANVFPGKYEARFSWIAVNMLRGTTKPSQFLGMAETGSSSIQLAFAVQEKPNISTNVDEVELFGDRFSLYEYSYLCYGEAEGIRRTHAELVKKANYTTDVVIDDPCSNEGYNWTRTAEYLWSVPCVKGDYAVQMFGSSISGPNNDTKTYKLRGTGKPQECLNLIQGMIPNNCSKNKPCGLNDVSQPTVRGKYLALASFYYTTSYMGLPFNGNQSEYWEKTQNLCNTPYDKLSPPYPEDKEKYKSKRCFQSVFTYFLLDDGFKFSKDNWDVEYTHKINGKGVEWTLGVAYQYRDDAYIYQEIHSHYRTAFVVGIVLLVVAVIAIVVSVVCIRRSHSSSDYEDA